jgi:hypothetical protein
MAVLLADVIETNHGGRVRALSTEAKPQAVPPQ